MNERYKFCKECGEIVEVKRIYEVNHPEPCPPTLIDIDSICPNCGHDVIEDPCKTCNGEGCYGCMKEIAV